MYDLFSALQVRVRVDWSMVILPVINNLIQNSDEPFWFQVLGKKQSL